MANSITKYEMAIWHSLKDGHDYAFPLGAKDTWGQEIYAEINLQDWTFVATLPRGVPVAGVRTDAGQRIRCMIAGRNVYTAAWAIS